MDDMTDVVVRIDVADTASETRLFEAIDKFAMKKVQRSDRGLVPDDAPDIMIKADRCGEFRRKAVIFQDQQSAQEFMMFWRRVNKNA